MTLFLTMRSKFQDTLCAGRIVIEMVGVSCCISVIRDCFSFIEWKELIPNQLEMVCIEICRKYGKPFLISAWYRPPNSNIDLFDSFEMFINKCEIESKELLVLGDLNCDWNKTPLDSHTQKLKNICVLYQLSQIIDEPTRVTISLQQHRLT